MPQIHLVTFFALTVSLTACRTQTSVASSALASEQSQQGASPGFQNFRGQLSWTDANGRHWKLLGRLDTYSDAARRCEVGFRLPKVAELKAQGMHFWTSAQADESSQKGLVIGRMSETVTIPHSQRAAVLCISHDAPLGNEDDLHVLRNLEEDCGEYFQCDQYDSWVTEISMSQISDEVKAATQNSLQNRLQSGLDLDPELQFSTEINQSFVVKRGSTAIGYVIELSDYVNHPLFDGAGAFYVYSVDGTRVASWEWSG